MATEFERTLSPAFIRECFEDRGGVIYWRERPEHHFCSPQVHQGFLSKYANGQAGRRCGDGYIAIHIRIDGKRRQLQAHRVVWMLHHGKWPDQIIDHINRIRSDNRIENLRDVTTEENLKNSTARPVHPYVAAERYGRFSAQVRIGKKGVHIGVFSTEEEAAAHREMVNAELEKVARALAKRSPLGPRSKQDTCANHQRVPGGEG